MSFGCDLAARFLADFLTGSADTSGSAEFSGSSTVTSASLASDGSAGCSREVSFPGTRWAIAASEVGCSIYLFCFAVLPLDRCNA
ncbi:MAG: hypothetical protein HC899_30880 [Leptolyngbyaceae cyanobacterium SM1_4_3]|nr:hypothetical protein [Leptolyngbyaceae cyanobacterium SM1_4_3]